MLVFEGNAKISLFNGSYQEYYETYGTGMTGETGRTSGGNISGAEAYKQQKEQNKKVKMTYNEQREYETIEDDIAELEEKIAQLDKALADPKIASDFVKLGELGKEKEEAEAQLDEKLERYVYLEELAEQTSH